MPATRQPAGMQWRQIIAYVLVALQLSTHTAADFSGWQDGLTGLDLKRYLLELHTNSTVLDTSLLVDPNVQALHGRQLSASQQLNDWSEYAKSGRYVVIKNPSMPGAGTSCLIVAVGAHSHEASAAAVAS